MAWAHLGTALLQAVHFAAGSNCRCAAVWQAVQSRDALTRGRKLADALVTGDQPLMGTHQPWLRLHSHRPCWQTCCETRLAWYLACQTCTRARRLG